MASVHVIIVAAGSGLRFGAPLPKQFCLLRGRPVVMNTIDTIRGLLPDAEITLVINRDANDLWQSLCAEHEFTSPDIVYGGATRWESVRNAVVHAPETDIILVHDAVRPLISEKIITPLIDSFSSQSDIDGAIPAIPVTDSLRSLTSGGKSTSVDRSAMRAVQTPQAFRGERLRKAYSLPYQPEFTDDASVMEAAGFDRIILTDGSPDNIKITNPGDISIAEILMENRV